MMRLLMSLERRGGLAPQKGVRNCSWQREERTVLRPRPSALLQALGRVRGQANPDLQVLGSTPWTSPVGRSRDFWAHPRTTSRDAQVGRAIRWTSARAGACRVCRRPQPRGWRGAEAGIVAGAQLQPVEAAGDGEEARRGARALGSRAPQAGGRAARSGASTPAARKRRTTRLRKAPMTVSPRRMYRKLKATWGGFLTRLVVLQRHQARRSRWW